MTEEETKTAQEDFGDRVSRKLWATFWFGALILNLLLISSLYASLPGAVGTHNGAEAAYFLIPMILCFMFPFIGVCLIGVPPFFRTPSIEVCSGCPAEAFFKILRAHIV